MYIIINSESEQIISDLGTNLRSQNYYKAYHLLIEKNDYYYNHESSNIPKSIIIFLIVFLSLILLFITCMIIFTSCLLPGKENLV